MTFNPEQIDDSHFLLLFSAEDIFSHRLLNKTACMRLLVAVLMAIVGPISRKAFSLFPVVLYTRTGLDASEVLRGLFQGFCREVCRPAAFVAVNVGCLILLAGRICSYPNKTVCRTTRATDGKCAS